MTPPPVVQHPVVLDLQLKVGNEYSTTMCVTWYYSAVVKKPDSAYFNVHANKRKAAQHTTDVCGSGRR